jgi:hypothetical protein
VGRKISITVALAVLLGALVVPAARAMDLKRLMAPASVCANQANPGAGATVQERAMRCMTDFARRRAGKAGLADARALDRSALHKAGDILRCDSFSHYACGRHFTYWMQRARYLPAPCWRVGENIAWGTGDYDSVRSIFRAWIHSPTSPKSALASESAISTAIGGSTSGPSTSARIARRRQGRRRLLTSASPPPLP